LLDYLFFFAYFELLFSKPWCEVLFWKKMLPTFVLFNFPLKMNTIRWNLRGVTIFTSKVNCNEPLWKSLTSAISKIRTNYAFSCESLQTY
jgi:hypothetical protein